ncbi:hypothetical protein LCGC14_2006880 [marine sediment metagenome]|uniref:Uncharacterized protein n=1 Tax=marine sediment metagenome TaxID=412755 RepID=A0A0F9F1E9_9ZZZZ
MWHGYFLISKLVGFSIADKTVLLLIGNAQTKNLPHLNTQTRYSLDNTKVIIEASQDKEPIQSELGVTADSFSVYNGSDWEAMRQTTSQFLKDNKIKWEPE